MATIYAMGGTRDWAVAGSFNTARDGSGSAGLPADGDTLIVADETYVNGGHAALANINLVAVFVRGNLTASSTLSFEVSSGTTGEMVINNRTGRLLIASTNDGIDSLRFAPVSGGAELSLESGTFPLVTQNGGRLDAQASAVVTTMHKSAGTGIHYKCATAITTLNHTGGSIDTRRNVTTINNHGASVTVYGDAALATIVNSGTVSDRSTGTPTTLTMHGGIYSPAGSPVSRTITNFNWYGGSVVTRVGGVDILAFTTTTNTTGQQTMSTQQVPPYGDAGGFLNN
jgi:hypothetical protein